MLATSTPVPTYTATPENSTVNDSTGQSDAQVQAQPTEESAPSTSIPPTAAPVPKPMVTINNDMNVREGPGTDYPVMGIAPPGQQFSITGKNSAGDWWRIDYRGQGGWVYGPLVTATDDSSVRVAVRIPPTPKPPPPTRTPIPAPIPLSQVERAAIWISLVNHEFGYLEVFAQVSFKVDVFDLDVLVHGEEYCNDRILYDDEPATKLSCGILEYSHSTVSDVRVRVNEDLWSEGDRYRCERNKGSTHSRSVFACERVRE